MVKSLKSNTKIPHLLRANLLHNLKGIIKYLFFAVLLFNGFKVLSDDEINSYTVLEIPKTASPSEIVRAYRKKAMKWHPDKNSNLNAQQKFMEIRQAYEILKDPDRRWHYDRYFSTQSNQEEWSSTYDPEFDEFLNRSVVRFARMKPKDIEIILSRSLMYIIIKLFRSERSKILFSALLHKIENQYSKHSPNRESLIFRNIQLLFGEKVGLDIVLTIDFIQNTETAERFLSYFSSNPSKEVVAGVLFVAQNLPPQSFSRILQGIIENSPKQKIVIYALGELSKIDPEKTRNTLISLAVNSNSSKKNRLYVLKKYISHFEKFSETEIRTLQQAQSIETNRKIKRVLSQLIQRHSQTNSSLVNNSPVHSTLTSEITRVISRTLSWRSLSKEEQAQILKDFTSLISQQISRLNPFHNSSDQNKEISQKKFVAVAINHSLSIKIRKIALESLSWKNIIEAEKKQILQGLMSIALNNTEDKKLRIRALNILNTAHADLSSIELNLLNNLVSNKKESKTVRSQAKKTVKRATSWSSSVCEKSMSGRAR